MPYNAPGQCYLFKLLGAEALLQRCTTPQTVSLGTYSKPKRKLGRPVELFTNSRLPKLHCSIQIISKYTLKKLQGIETLSQVQSHTALHLGQRKEDMK